MISSDDGLAILRNWKTHKAVLWVVTLDLPDTAFGPTIRIREVSDNPPGFVSVREGSPEILATDLSGATFNDAIPEGFASKEFLRFLEIKLPDGRRFLFAELKPDWGV